MKTTERQEEHRLLNALSEAYFLFDGVAEALNRSRDGTKIEVLLQEAVTLAEEEVIKSDNALFDWRQIHKKSEENKFSKGKKQK